MTGKELMTTCGLLVLSMFCQGQNTGIKNTQLSNSKTIRDSVLIYNEWATKYRSIDLDTSYLYITEALKLVDNNRNAIPDSLYYLSLWQRGQTQFSREKYNEALMDYDVCTEGLKSLGLTNRYLEVRNNELSSLLKIRALSHSLIDSFELELQQHKNAPMYRDLLYNASYIRAQLYNIQGDREKAVQICLKLLEDKNDDDVQSKYRVETLNSLAIYLKASKHYDEAKKYYLEALALNNLSKYQRSLILSNIASLHLDKMEYDSVFQYCKRAEAVEDILPENEYYINLNRSKAFFEMEDYQKALTYLNICQNIKGKTDDVVSQLDLKLQLASIYMVMGNFNKSKELSDEVYEYLVANPEKSSVRWRSFAVEKMLDNALLKMVDSLTHDMFVEYTFLRDSMQMKSSESKIAAMEIKFRRGLHRRCKFGQSRICVFNKWHL